MSFVLALYIAIAPGSNDDLGFHRFGLFHDGIRVVAFIRNYGIGFVLTQQLDGLRQSFTWPAVMRQSNGRALFVGEHVDLGRQTSSGTPCTLSAPSFCGLRPPAGEPVRWLHPTLGIGFSFPVPVPEKLQGQHRRMDLQHISQSTDSKMDHVLYDLSAEDP